MLYVTHESEQEMVSKKSSKTVKSSETKDLKKENEALKRRLHALEAKRSEIRTNTGKNALSKLFLVLAGTVFILGSITLYIGMTLTDTTRFMKVAGPLIEQPAVQEKLASKTTSALFSAVNTEQFASEILPERINFLAPTLAQQIEQFTNDKAREAIATDTFRQTWVSSIEKSHRIVITNLKNSTGDGVLQMQEVYDQLGKRVEDGKLSFLSGKQLPENIGNITLVSATWLPTAREVVANITILRIASLTLFTMLLVFSILFASQKRRTIIQIGSMIGVLSVLMVLSLRITKEYFIAATKPENQELATQVATVFGRPFILQLAITAVIGVCVALIAWLGGQSKSAKNFKKAIDTIFAGKLHQAFFKQENTLTLFVGKFSRELYMLITAGLFISLLIIDLGNSSLLTTFALAGVLALVVNTLGSKKEN
jgi:hypothetical protein